MNKNSNRKVFLGWLLTALGVATSFSLIYFYYLEMNRYPLSLLFKPLNLFFLSLIITGLGFIKLKNWAKWLCLIQMSVFIFYGLIALVSFFQDTKNMLNNLVILLHILWINFLMPGTVIYYSCIPESKRSSISPSP